MSWRGQQNGPELDLRNWIFKDRHNEYAKRLQLPSDPEREIDTESASALVLFRGFSEHRVLGGSLRGCCDLGHRTRSRSEGGRPRKRELLRLAVLGRERRIPRSCPIPVS